MSEAAGLHHDHSGPGDLVGSVDEELGTDVLLPIVEGARARGVADAFELIGQGALLLDGAGTVLHAGASALRLMGDDLSIQSGHLVAQTATANRTIQELVETVLERRQSETAVIERADGAGTIILKGLAFNPTGTSAYQLLAVVVLIDEFHA